MKIRMNKRKQQQQQQQVFASEQSGKKETMKCLFFKRAWSFAAADHDLEATKFFFLSFFQQWPSSPCSFAVYNDSTEILF